MAATCLSSLSGSHVLRSEYSPCLSSVKPSFGDRGGQVSFASPVAGYDIPSLSAFCSGRVSLPRRSNAAAELVASAYASDLDQMSESVSDGESDGVPFLSSQKGVKLYVGNLPWTCNSQNLAEIFQEYGEVEMVEVLYDRESGKSRGFGFVTMCTQDGANASIQSLDGADLGGRTLKVNFPDTSKGSLNRQERSPRREFGSANGGGSYGSNENKLFVSNLPWGLDDDGLEQLFNDFGTIIEAKVIYDRVSGKSRGFGFVTLSSASETSAAIDALDGASCGGRPLRVSSAGEKPPRRDMY